jgi:hypothetical protein
MAKITFNRSGGFIDRGLGFELNLNALLISAVIASTTTLSVQASRQRSETQ